MTLSKHGQGQMISSIADSPPISNIEWRRFTVYCMLALSTWIIPPPEGMSSTGWHTFGFFAATIIGFLLRPLAMGPLVLVSLIGLSATHTIKFKTLLLGFGNGTVWLVVAAFLIAGAVGSTGFGHRLALTLVAKLGRSTLGLAYALCGAELLLGPVVPSSTARGGGIMAPVVQSLADALHSTPTENPGRIGRFLVLVGAHANIITAAMFLTGMAANPLVSKAAHDLYGIDFGWGQWALGAIVPGLIGLGLLPLFIHKIDPPEIDDTRAAQQSAKRDLKEMGAWSRSQKIVAGLFVVLLLLWSSKGLHGMGSGLVAWIGVIVLLLTNVQKWEEITGNSKAWDTLTWLGGLIAMANALKSEGVIDWAAARMQSQVAGLDAVLLAVVLALIYFLSMYGFSMLTAHISALAAAVLAIAVAGGAPALLIVPLIAYFSNLCACTTNYSTGPVIIYYGLGYMSSPKWFSVGAKVAVFHIVIWLGVGMTWWKFLGWW